MKTSRVVIIVILWSPILGALIGGLIGFFVAGHLGFSGSDLKSFGMLGSLLLCSLVAFIFIKPGMIEGLITEVK
jgi:hypothetical protein